MSVFPRSRSLELNSLAMWQQKITYINLVKSEKGLGFSLIDYQHNQHTPLSKTMIVIRALVPFGVAQLNGQLMPGQRLVSINEVSLDEDLTIKENDPNIKAFSNEPNKSINLFESKRFINYVINLEKQT
jgi:hypothetical protein